MHQKAQTNVVYMGFFIILGLVFMGFIFTFSSDFKKDSVEEVRTYLSESIFTRIEKNLLELKEISSQEDIESITKTVNIPRFLGEEIYQIIGRNETIIIHSVSGDSFYTEKSFYWNGLSFEGSANSQNSAIHLSLNTTTNIVRIS